MAQLGQQEITGAASSAICLNFAGGAGGNGGAGGTVGSAGNSGANGNVSPCGSPGPDTLGGNPGGGPGKRGSACAPYFCCFTGFTTGAQGGGGGGGSGTLNPGSTANCKTGCGRR